MFVRVPRQALPRILTLTLTLTLTLGRRIAQIPTLPLPLPPGRRIATQLVDVNSSLASLPDLALLQDRLGRVYYGQTADHICASLPPGWQPGDVTECDVMQEQLRQTRATLEAMDAASPSSLLASFDELLDSFPRLLNMSAALELERDELDALPNLTRVGEDYAALDGTISSWNPLVIGEAITATRDAALALAAADIDALMPDFEAQHAAIQPLSCVGTMQQQLVAVNTSLLRLPADVVPTPRLEAAWVRGKGKGEGSGSGSGSGLKLRPVRVRVWQKRPSPSPSPSPLTLTPTLTITSHPHPHPHPHQAPVRVHVWQGGPLPRRR